MQLLRFPGFSDLKFRIYEILNLCEISRSSVCILSPAPSQSSNYPAEACNLICFRNKNVKQANVGFVILSLKFIMVGTFA